MHERLPVKMGFGRSIRQRSGPPYRHTYVTIASVAVFILLGSIYFAKSGGQLGPDFGGTMWRLSMKQHVLSRNSEVYGWDDAYDNDGEEKDSLREDTTEPEILRREPKLMGNQLVCNKKTAILKVFMYDLPPEFHFGMIGKTYSDHIWPRNMSEVPNYPGGLNLQHSPEYWLTLDLLVPAMLERNSLCTAILVENPKDADVFFVPYFSSLSYNKYTRSEGTDGTDRNVELQEKLVRILLRQNPWRRSGGRNHVIVMHHPNSLHVAREQLRNAMFIVADFGRYSPQVANVGKDVVAPYRHVVPSFKADDSTYDSRTTLLYFQGVIVRKEGGIIRQQLYEMLKDEPDVHFSTGTAQKDGIRSASQGMRSSKFCLHLAGDTPSSNRLFDAIVSHCVPVIISDDIELPYEDELDYTDFCIFVRSSDALQSGFVMDLLHSVKKIEWTRMWNKLKQVDRHFEYQHPTLPNDAVNMIWKTIARRVPSVKQNLNKGKRYSRARSISRS